MTEIFSCISAIASAIATITTVYYTRKNSQAQMEISLSEFMYKARKDFEDAQNEYETNKYQDVYELCAEKYLATFDESCSKALQKKVSRKWFSSTYDNDLRKITSEKTVLKDIYNEANYDFKFIRQYCEKFK